MSYILDALKRADADRQRDRGAIPDLHTRQSQPSPAPAFFARDAQSLPLWTWAAAACLIAGAAGAWWLWAQRLPGEPAALAQPTAAAALASNLPTSGPASRANPLAVVPATQPQPPPSLPLSTLAVPQPDQTPAAGSPVAAPATQAQPAVADAARREAGENTRALKAEKQALADQTIQLRLQEAADKRKAQKDAKEQAAAQKAARLASTSAATAKSVTTATTAPAGTAAATNEDQRIYPLADLPPEVRQQLPALVLSGATYSENPLYRMLIINGQVFQEKSMPAPGVTLERIQPKQAVLVFRGYRYFVKY